MSKSIVLAAGGTGGHLFPAEALAGELLGLGRKVHLLSEARVEAFAGGIAGLEVHRVRAGRFGNGAAQSAHAFGELALGALQARRLLRRLSPACIVGFGGYSSIPPMLAAVYLGLPTIIHEQNAVLGRANRFLAQRVRRIAASFPETSGLRVRDLSRTVHTGNPVRPAFLAVGQAGYKAPQRGGPVELVILGGSQGARILSEIVPPALAALPTRWREMLRVTQQARPEDLSTVREIYRKNRIAAELQSFFTDLPERLARAHLVICRAGASTVAELAAIGRPAVLIPYPHATADHQTANARAFAEAGGGWVIPQSELRADTLVLHLERLFGDQALLSAAAEASRQFGNRDATQRLARLAMDFELGADHFAHSQGCAA